MDDFRSQLAAVIDTLTAAGVRPVFLVVDLDGIDDVKRTQGAESVANLRAGAVDAITAAAGGCDAFTYDEQRVVAILPGFPRLKTFALIERLRRALPLLGQSYDCTLRPEFDVIEYEDEHGVAGLISQLVRPRPQEGAA